MRKEKIVGTLGSKVLGLAQGAQSMWLTKSMRSYYKTSDASMRPAAVPESMCWFWSMTVNGPMTRAGRVPTLEEAKAHFQKSWDAWKAWAKLEEAP